MPESPVYDKTLLRSLALKSQGDLLPKTDLSNQDSCKGVLWKSEAFQMVSVQKDRISI